MLASTPPDYKAGYDFEQPLTIVIATRESRLALWQAEHVKGPAAQRGHTVRCWA
jgi:hypothetical protein